ncbi:hypothetical protein Xen7305DRAFT_00024230 [Xenococcus sp. PCC 7305]|uniref:hypothetical protein n=1 Tax=Xenococcus sp. PCC 7305 TaxID=102125 RepID=UPI0002ABBE36|nr:hypothetical protein [Xenococcus sp. PCC 7305]ELS02705.1 hypothetical protein Xen7305DRAFT_00024230 [Xenococcus sp. PCC 7305]
MVDKNQKWPHTPKNGVDGLTDYKDFLIHHDLRESILKAFVKYLESYDDKDDLFKTFPEKFNVRMENSIAGIEETLPIDREKIEMITHHLMRGIDGLLLDDPAPSIPEEYLSLAAEALRRYKEQQR